MKILSLYYKFQSINELGVKTNFKKRLIKIFLNILFLNVYILSFKREL